MSISINGDGIISGVSTLTNPSEITVGTGASVFSPSANTLALGTNNTEKVRIDSSGNVGIGTDNPSGKLEINSGNDNLNLFLNSTDGDVNFGMADNGGSIRLLQAGGELAFRVNGAANLFGSGDAERLRIDSSGRLLVGTSSARTNFHGGSVAYQQQIEGTAYNTSAPAFICDSNTAGHGPHVTLARSRGTSVGSNTVVQSDDVIGVLNFQGNDGTNFVNCARIITAVDGTPGSNDMPGRLVFSTTADGASSPTERMRISHNGGTSHFATAASHGFRATQTAGTDSILFVQNNSSSVTTGSNVFIVRADGDVENATGNYTAFSDQKLKENIVDANSQWDDIKSIQIRNFNFKEETGLPTHTQIGVIAQELEQICPNLVKDVKVTNDGEDTYKTVKSSILYMKTVKALQEAMERIETLETANASQAATIAALDARLTALEGN